MTLSQSVCDVLRDHVVLESECIDRMYLNVYVPQLQRVGGVVWYLRGHLGQRFASTATVAPKTVAFVAGIEKFVAAQGVDLVSFGKHQRKDDITLQYLQQFDADEGVLYVGRAQEKARVVRTERRRCARTGMSYPCVIEGSAMVNHYYFYCVDDDFGPFFLKFCSYFPYKPGCASTATSTPGASCASAASPSRRWTTASSRAKTPRRYNASAMGSTSARLIGCCASGWHDCRIRSTVTTGAPATATRYRSCRPSSP
ncbi:hypothetical protein P3T40_008987 [Paraburkholderia sp. EB58]|uniref:hypothetical protein n=1 Tax=Paraburkholderia sp. EB58 TaxID=3035125 RepID=UPI003D1E299C